MKDACPSISPETTLLINVAMHITLLLAIISSFYFVYVRHLSEHAYHLHIEKAITVGLGPMIRKIPRNIVNNIDVSGLAQYYKSTPTLSDVVQNQWLEVITIVVVVLLVTILLVAITILRMGCGACVWPIMKHLLIENAAVFTLVGMLEIGFFLLIARKYVPVKPSLLLESTIEQAKKVLSGDMAVHSVL